MTNHRSKPSPHFARRLSVTLLSCALVATPLSPSFAQGQDANSNANSAMLNFVGADIESVIKAVGQYTNTTFIIDPRVKGTINLVSEKALTKDQALRLLTSTLRLQGYAMVNGDGFTKVVPEADAKLQAASGKLRGDQIATQIYHLNYESAANLVPVLRPLISPNNTINANPGNNTLVVTDYAENLQRFAKMIAALDVPAVNDLDVIPIRYAVASDMAVMVSKLLDSDSTAPGVSDSARTMIMADSRTNSVVVRAPSSGRANLARSLIAKLDQPTTNAGNVHVVYLKNADAVKLAKTLRAIVSNDSSFSGAASKSLSNNSGGMLQGSNGGSTLNSGTTLGNVNTTQQQPSTDLSAQSSGGGGSGGNGGAAGFIQADDSTNTLIITASEPIYRNIRGVIDQLDTRRAQVYVEALIVEVNDSAASEIGVQWLALSGDSNSAYRVGGGTGFVGTNAGITNGNLFSTAIGLAANNGTSPTPVTLGSGLQLGVFRQIAGKIGLGALASALNSTVGSNVLSMPNLLTLDNEEARIIVGQNVPFISGSTLTTSGGTSSPFTTVDRKDVGTALKIKPHISEGGTVRLEISQEVSAVLAGTAANPNGPTTSKRSLDTNVVIDDGEIIALGGLIGDDSENSVQKVPLLGDLPYVGNLFKYQSGSRNKTNLMIFLRPTIVRDKNVSANLAMDRYDYMRSQQVRVQPGKTILTDFGSSVNPKLEDGGPFIDLRKKQIAPNQLVPEQQQMPLSNNPPVSLAPVLSNDTTR